MAAPSKNFTVQPDSQVDADSPLDTTLITEQRDNDIHLEEWLGKNYTAAVDHDHDGTNSKLVATVADAGITQAKLSTATATGSVVINAGSSNSLALTNTYSWWTGSADSDATRHTAWGGGNTAAGTIGLFCVGGSGSNTFFIDERYIQASPPYNIGNIKWGHFLFVLRTIGTGVVKGAYESADPPWGSRALWIKDKNSTERMLVAPHNFADYWDKNPASDGLEIIMVDLRGFDMDALKLFCQKEEVRLRKGVKPWEELLKTITIGNQIPYDTFGIVPTTGLTDRMKIIGRT
jgi:hypothetical protein